MSAPNDPGHRMTADEVKRRIEAGLPGAVADVRTPDEVHFDARVVAAQFEGLRTLKRHQLVYGAIGTAVGGEIHALALETLTPAEAATRG